MTASRLSLTLVRPFGSRCLVRWRLATALVLTALAVPRLLLAGTGTLVFEFANFSPREASVTVDGVAVEPASPSRKSTPVTKGEPVPPVTTRSFVERTTSIPPLFIRGLSAGEHTLAVTHPSFDPWTQQVFVRNGETTPVSVTLSPKPATLRLDVRGPAEFKLRVSGLEVPLIDGRIVLPAWEGLQLELIADGFESVRRMIVLAANGEELWSVPMNQIRQADGSPPREQARLIAVEELPREPLRSKLSFELTKGDSRAGKTESGKASTPEESLRPKPDDSSAEIEPPARSTSPPRRYILFAELDELPREVTGIRPTYPRDLSADQQIDGWVEVGFIVDSRCCVRDAYIIRSSHAEFEEPALEAIRRCRFTPGRKDGQDVLFNGRRLFEFRLSD